MKIRPSPHLYLSIVALLILLCKAESANLISQCNGTIAECIAGEDEFMMESETSRRILAGNPQGKKLSYKGLQKPPVCDARIYGNCIDPANKDNRPCTLYNRCKRNVR